ncbi:MAG: carboxypeptidase-like regulatory domain-containing protein, partial [Haloarculaceae archaeon]
MRATSRKLCSLYLTGLLVLTAFASGVGTMGVVAASGNTAGNASLTTPQTAANAAADYHVVGNFPTTTGTVDTVRVDFGGSAANFGYTIVERNRVKIDGTPVDVGSTSVAKGGEAFDLELASPQSVDGPVTVSTDLLGVENPPTVGTHDVTVGLRAGDGSVLKQAGGTVTIVEGGTVRGSVLDAASGNVVVDRSTRVTVSDRASGAELTTHGTSPSGTYSMTVPAGTYFVNVTSDGYARGSETVSVTTGTTVDRDVSLDTGGTVSGTVTDGSGDPVAGLDVSVYREPTNTYVKRTQTAADGSYSFALDPDTSSYVVVAGGGTSDYEVAFEGGVTVSDGATTTVDLTAAEKPPSGDIEVTVEAPKGDPVSGATVSYRNSDFSYGGRATTDPSGVATISEPAGVYTLRVEADGYGTEVVRGVTNNASETNAVTVGLESPAYISGTVMTSAFAILLGGPVSVGIAVVLTQYA